MHSYQTAVILKLFILRTFAAKVIAASLEMAYIAKILNWWTINKHS